MVLNAWRRTIFNQEKVPRGRNLFILWSDGILARDNIDRRLLGALLSSWSLNLKTISYHSEWRGNAYEKDNVLLWSRCSRGDLDGLAPHHRHRRYCFWSRTTGEPVCARPQLSSSRQMRVWHWWACLCIYEYFVVHGLIYTGCFVYWSLPISIVDPQNETVC